jgi:ribosomal protein S18 acetylase RimI-like enzyme
MTATQTSAPTIRPPQASDRARVRAMVEATGVFRPAEVDIALEVFDDAVARPGTDYTALGAFDGERLVGFTAFGPTPGTEGTWDLYWIVVDPTVHRAGIGRRLMTATETSIEAEHGRLIVVQTSSRPDYEPTRRFYEKIGYDRAAHVPEYYAQNDGLVVFTKQLITPSPSSGG